MIPSPIRVALNYLTREPTDTVSDIVFNQVGMGITATLPRLSDPVGEMYLQRVDLDKRVSDGRLYSAPHDTLRWQKHLDDLKTLRLKLRLPDLGVIGVSDVSVDKRFRGEAVGERMYLIAAAYAASKNCVLAPNHVWEGANETSGDALRVWSKLVRLLPHEGTLVWGQGLNLPRLLSEPLRPRRGHGFGNSKPVPEPHDF